MRLEIEHHIIRRSGDSMGKVSTSREEMVMDERTMRRLVTRRQLLRSVLVGGAGLSLLGACGGGQATPTAVPSASPTPAQAATPTTAAAAGPVPTVAPGTKITVAIVPKLVHPIFEDVRKGG